MPDRSQLGLVRIARESVQDRVYSVLRDRLMRGGFGAEQNRAFHFAIYRRSGSAVLLPIIESLWLQFGPYLRVASERFDGREGRGTNFHVEIVSALATGDGKATRTALESDILRSFDLVMTDPTFRREQGGAA